MPLVVHNDHSDDENSDDEDWWNISFFSFFAVFCETMKRVNVQMPDDVHTRAKVIAVLKGVTLNEYLETAIREAVDKDKSVLDALKRK